MPRLVTYRCPECRGEFEFLHHPSDEPPPDHCEICNAWMGDGPEKAPVLHLNFGKEKNRVPDQVYRRMESASAARAEDAAAMVGASASEMSAVKITNLKGGTYEGEHAAVVQTPTAMKQLSTPAAQPVYQNPQAAQWAQETTSGEAALSTRSLINEGQRSGFFNQKSAEMTRAGSDGKRY